MNDELVQRVRVIIWAVEVGNATRDEASRAIIPIIASHERERCAKVADACEGSREDASRRAAYRRVAAAIRNMKDEA